MSVVIVVASLLFHRIYKTRYEIFCKRTCHHLRLLKKIQLRRNPYHTRSLYKAFQSYAKTTAKMENKDQVLRHEIITSVADIPKFSDEPTTIDINQFLHRIDIHNKQRNKR